MEDLLKCPLCFNLFNLSNYKPLIAICGHSFCKHCLTITKINKELLCPLCELPYSMRIESCIPNNKLEQIIKLYNVQERKKPMIYIKPEEARNKSPGVMIKKKVIVKNDNIAQENNLKLYNNDGKKSHQKQQQQQQLYTKKNTYFTDPNQKVNEAKSIFSNNANNKMEKDDNSFIYNIELIPLEQDQSIANMSLSIKDEYPELFNNINNKNIHSNKNQIKNTTNNNNSNSNSNNNDHQNNNKRTTSSKNYNKTNTVTITKEEALIKLKKELAVLIPTINKRKLREFQLIQALDKTCFKDKYFSLDIKLLQPNEDFLIERIDPNTSQVSFGVIYASNGDYYEGDIFNERKEGFGLYKYKCGSKYEGLFKYNHPNGYGKLIQQDGEVFIGQWKDGKINGNGIRYHNNGDRYIGTYVNNIRNGNGHYLFSNGDSYDGNWENGKANGQGKFFFKNGNYYEGQFFDNLITGKGVFKILNGNIFTGTFKTGLINGNGTLQMVNGDIYKGDFVNGKRQGNGIVYGANGQIKSQGKWFNDKQLNNTTNQYE